MPKRGKSSGKYGLVEGDWFASDWIRDDLIDVTYSGKYALWQMHQELQKLSRIATTVTGEIVNFPKNGPDRNFSKPLPSPSLPAKPPAGDLSK
jgi:hypothetical protein